MWPADKLGDIHTVTSNVGIWSCVGTPADCQSKEPINMELEVTYQYTLQILCCTLSIHLRTNPCMTYLPTSSMCRVISLAPNHNDIP